MWCSAPPQWSNMSRSRVRWEPASRVPISIHASCRDAESLQNSSAQGVERRGAGPEKGINITALGGFTSIIFETSICFNARPCGARPELERHHRQHSYRLGDVARLKQCAIPGNRPDQGQGGGCRCHRQHRKCGLSLADCRTGVGELLLVRQRQHLVDLQQELGGGRVLSLDELCRRLMWWCG